MTKPIELSEQAIKWMEHYGMTINLSAIPKMRIIEIEGVKSGDVDESEAMIAFSLRRGQKVDSGQSEYFQVNKANIRAAFEDQLEKALVILESSQS